MPFFSLKNKDESSIGVVQIMKTIKIKIKTQIRMKTVEQFKTYLHNEYTDYIYIYTLKNK